MESKFNVGDTVVYQDNYGKFVEGVVQEVMVSYYVKPKEECKPCSVVSQEKAYKDKQEVIKSLGLND